VDDRSNDPGHVGPRIDPGWLDVIRQVVMFALGVWLIVHAAVTPGHDISFLVTGLVLFGMIPVEQILKRRHFNHNNEEDDP
jgi:ABC-type protease/lipase transport system fused ATPase/permease subunit